MPDQMFRGVPDLIRAQAGQRPEHPALVLDDRSLDYADLDALTDRVAASLQRDGLVPGDVIAISAAASLEYVAVFLGSVRAGVVVAPLAPDLSAQGRVELLANSGATIFFLNQAVARSLGPVAPKISARRIAIDDSDAGAVFSDWLAPPGAAPKSVGLQPDWPFNIIYSSGTTGTPKGILHSHALRRSNVDLCMTLGFGPDTVSLIAIPLYSNTTLTNVLPTLSLGGTVVLMGKFDVAVFLALSEKHRVTHTMLVPVQYQRIMAHPDFDRFDLSSCRLKFSGGAPFSARL
ncbi:MAG: class I adenylate-forming enzyme family protein, partial [Sulfuricaulis sp.]|nr:class I adenylate-forming enzyme family protein [Sulfuricaulis sp.]